ncbi:MAG: chalcone isomerase family protein [Alphaproteobacteria bacterium]|nr:chalcone isomerase family protein [Alphaproteobacteria bacterium]
MHAALLSALLFLSPPAPAAELAGVTVADDASVAGQTLVLNGVGLREKYFVDVYVGALYLPQKTQDAEAAITLDAPKRIAMHFIYKEVTRAQMAETFHEGLEKIGATEALAPRMAKLEGWLVDAHKGDVVVLDYQPGKGTTLVVNGSSKGTVEGADFMQAIWRIYLGEQPASKKLRDGMLGR